MLDETNGPLRRWWDQELPNIKTVTRDGNWKTPLAAPPPETARGGGTACLVGTATDYRARWLWPHDTADDLVGVGHGAYTAFSRARADRFTAVGHDPRFQRAAENRTILQVRSTRSTARPAFIHAAACTWRPSISLDHHT